MWPILHGSDRRLFVKLATALLVAFSLLPAEPADSLLLQMAAVPDSTAQVPADSLVPSTSESLAPNPEPRTSNPDSGGVAGVSPAEGVADAAEGSPTESGMACGGSEGEASPDTSKNCFSVDLSTGEINPSDIPKSEIRNPNSGPKKSVLYLSGGERSPWFHLGVLYAIENYKVRIDSVVGTSWGAFVGYLWAHGMTLDDIQRILLDPHLQGYVGHNMFDDLYNKKPEQAKWPIASNGVPSLRYRFALEPDTSMTLRKIPKSIEPDTTVQRYALAKLRLQEAMNRVPRGAVIPFKVLGCNGEEWETAEDVFKSLPLIENYNSGELCPGLAVPYEDVYDQVPIISVGIPRVAKASVSSWNSPWQRILFENSSIASSCDIFFFSL